jgi:hypothetical protein
VSLGSIETYEKVGRLRRGSGKGSEGEGIGEARSKGPGEGGGGVAKTFLSVEQQQVLAKVVADGQNIFFTGSAGEFPPTITPTKLIDRNR